MNRRRVRWSDKLLIPSTREPSTNLREPQNSSNFRLQDADSTVVLGTRLVTFLEGWARADRAESRQHQSPWIRPSRFRSRREAVPLQPRVCMLTPPAHARRAHSRSIPLDAISRFLHR